MLPAGAVLFEEDAASDAMFVLLAGTVQVRAQPLQAAAPGDQIVPVSAPAAGNTGSCPPGDARLTAAATWKVTTATDQDGMRLKAAQALLDVAGQTSVSDGLAQQCGTGDITCEGVFWTAQWMRDAAAAAPNSDADCRSDGGLAPLAAVFAAKCREQLRAAADMRHGDTTSEGSAASEAERAYAAMEDLLGKAAAKAWRAARDAAAAGSSGSGRQSITGVETPTAGDSIDSRDSNATAAAVQPVYGTAGQISSSEAAAEEAVMQMHSQLQAMDADTQMHRRRSHAVKEAAATAAEGLLAAAAAAPDPAASLKMQLAALGVSDPGDVSRALLRELAARSNLGALLDTVAVMLEARGLPRRLNRRGSLRVTRELNRRWEHESPASSTCVCLCTLVKCACTF